MHQSLPIYAGGLGVLAGDHCKEASDLGVPLIGVGFMYPQGYFHQGITTDGWQQEIYQKLNWTETAIEPALTAEGKPASRRCRSATESVLVAVWRVRVGRVTLYLLDTDLEENAPWDRELSARLYGGDRETRVQQEIILGIGGVRVLKAIGHQPVGLSSQRRPRRIRRRCSASATCARAAGRFDSALEEVRRTTVFTTHTPVAAGHDAFPFSTGRDSPGRRVGRSGRVSRAVPGARPLRQRRRPDVQHDGAGAARRAARSTRVSQLHGDVTKQMWRSIWPDRSGRRAAGQGDHQRRARADLDVLGDVRVLEKLLGAGLVRAS